MIDILQKLKDRFFGSHYEFTAPSSTREQVAEARVLIVQGSFAANRWQATAASKHVEHYPESACCGLDSLVTNKPIAHLKSPSGNDYFTNKEIVDLVSASYPDLSVVPPVEQVDLQAFHHLSKLCA